MYIVDTNKNKIYINKFLHLNFFAIHVNWLFWKKKFTDKFLKKKINQSTYWWKMKTAYKLHTETIYLT